MPRRLTAAAPAPTAPHDFFEFLSRAAGRRPIHEKIDSV